MTYLQIICEVEGFDWDDGNREKCTRHGLTHAEIEAAFSGPMSMFPDTMHSHDETRYLAIARAPSGRHMLVAFTLRRGAGGRLIRPISARYMGNKEVQHYEAEIAKSRQ